MELIELLKKLRFLKADSKYTKESRTFILSINKSEKAGFSSAIKEVISGVFRSGWSMALTAALLLLAISSFSILKLIYPATTAVVDITGLRAEAQAIDAQIELTSVTYNAILGIENKTSTTSIILPAARKRIVAETNKTNQIPTAESTSTAPTIDSVLNMLSE